MPYDLVIKNACIIDGAGNPWFKSDLAISDGKIAKLGSLSSRSADHTIDATGQCVSPGFIDIHSHSDVTIPFNPLVESALRQGITTLVVGNCGISVAPVNKKNENLLQRYLSPFLPSESQLKIEWSSFDEYSRWQEKKGCSANIANLAGHGTIRIAAMGFEERRPTCDEFENMKTLVEEAMEAGAFGMSTGLIYPPGIFSDITELIELSKVVAKYGGVYFSHIRGEGATLLEAVREAITIGEKADIPVQISHHKAAGKVNWGKTVETLKMMDEAREKGVDVTFDQYPYSAAMTTLVTLLPPWAHEGGVEKTLERLRDLVQREKMRKDIERGIPGWQNWVGDCGWNKITVSSVASKQNKALEGRNLAEIAGLRRKDEFTALCDLLLEEQGNATMVMHAMDEEDVRSVMKHHLQMVGTDAWSVAPYGVLGGGKPHPRFYGTYPRVLGKYSRDEKLLTLEEAIRKSTSFPAQKLQFQDRGIVREGFWADLVIFDPKKIMDMATFADPHIYPEGIEYVFVNGKIVIEKGSHTEETAGKILRHSSRSII
nr:D-aminoacylase [Candidatus Njordarchaeum guaymaensis]